MSKVLWGGGRYYQKLNQSYNLAVMGIDFNRTSIHTHAKLEAPKIEDPEFLVRKQEHWWAILRNGITATGLPNYRQISTSFQPGKCADRVALNSFP